MFKTIDEDLKNQRDPNTTYTKTILFLVAMGMLGLLIYFFAFTGMHK